MEPLIPIDPPTAPRSAKPARGTRADQLAAYLAFAAAAAALGVCAYIFAGFLENDENKWGTASAFFLCFGLGAFAYIPLWITGKIARKSYKEGPSKKRYKRALFLLLPWLIFSLALLFFSPLGLLYGLLLCALFFILVFWAVYSLSKI